MNPHYTSKIVDNLFYRELTVSASSNGLWLTVFDKDDGKLPTEIMTYLPDEEAAILANSILEALEHRDQFKDK